MRLTNHIFNNTSVDPCVDVIVADQARIKPFDEPAMEFLIQYFGFGEFFTVCANHIAVLAEFKPLFIQKRFGNIKQRVLCPSSRNIRLSVFKQKFGPFNGVERFIQQLTGVVIHASTPSL